ncbi:MAG: efflux RND transporter periplasmic adaptor subunit [Candidatus Buchananbacteria bacterium]
MKKIIKSKVFWIILALIIGGGILAKIYIFKAPVTEYVTQDVISGTVIQTVTATGKIKSATEIELNFKNPGKLSVQSVKKGDKVVVDQVLARQSSSDLMANVNKARSNVEQAAANLAKLKAGATSQDIAVYEVALQKAKSDWDNAKSDLASTKSTYSQAIDNNKSAGLNDSKNAIAKAYISLQKIYDTLNYQGYSYNFTTSDPVLQQKVSTGYEQAKHQVGLADSAYVSASSSQDLAQIKSLIDSTLLSLNYLATTLDDLSKLLDKVVVNSTLTRANLDTLKTSINAEWLTTNSSINTIQDDKQGVADAELNYQTKVEAAQNNVSTYERNYAKAQADLNLRKAPARTEDIRLYQAQVASAQADLQLALDRLDDTVIKAPIDGVITEVNVLAGEQTSLTQPVIKMLANQVYEVEVNIPESDIAKINVGDKAEITLDAFSSEDAFSGTITTIDPAETSIQDVIYYQLTVSLDLQQPDAVKDLVDKIKPGMTANVTVNTAKVENVLIAPLRAVKDEGNKEYVEILENNQPVKVEVILGLRGDDGQVEVKSGLTQGQKVITFVRTK